MRIFLCSLARVHGRLILGGCDLPHDLDSDAPLAGSSFDVAAEVRAFEAVGVYLR